MKTRKYHFYTNEQIEYLREISPTRTNKEITKMFNEKFNLEQSVRSVSAVRSERKIPSKHSHLNDKEKGRFKKGQSWNRGTIGIMKANKTSFKKGSIPANRVEIGTERFSKDGYVEIKVADGKQGKNWVYKHRLIWEKHYGKIPKGNSILFRDLDKTNLNIDNLICVTRSQLLFINQQDIEKTGEVIDVLLTLSKLEEAMHNKNNCKAVDINDKTEIYGLFKDKKLLAKGTLKQISESMNLKMSTLKTYGSRYRQEKQSSFRTLRKLKGSE